jgi:hypothetical protein
MIRRLALIGCLLTVGGAAHAQTSGPTARAGAGPQTWGTAAGATTILAHEFNEDYAASRMTRFLGAIFCDHDPDPLATTYALAQLHVPDGATLSQLQFWAYDIDAEDGLNISLWESCQPPGPAPPVSTPLASVDTFGSIGTYFGFTPLNDHRVNNRECGYTVRVEFNPGGVSCSGQALQLQKVRVGWVRDVAPAPFTESFLDVPYTHPFYQYIEALATSGVTGGCGGGNFCPDTPLKRGQMAVFLAKAMGLQWP